MIFPGFNKARRGTISNGDWDRDGVKNKKDCEPLNFRKQGPEHEEKEMINCKYCGAQTEKYMAGKEYSTCPVCERERRRKK